MKTLLHFLLLLGVIATAAHARPHDNDRSGGQRLRGSVPQNRQEDDENDRLLVTAANDFVSPKMVRLNHEHCSFDVEVQCRVVVEGGEQDGKEISCMDYKAPEPPVQEPCRQTPLTTSLLYNGGDCLQTDNVDELGITCQDGALGSPPTEEGARSYLVVTDAHEQSQVYYAGPIQVGGTYVLDAQGELMEYGFEATIYSDETKARPLQKVSYPPRLCSNDLELLNRFGGLQIVEYTNALQGEIKAFASVEHDYQVFVDVIITGALQNHRLDDVSLTTNFAGYHDLTSSVKQTKSFPLKPVVLTIPADNIDLSEARRNTMLVHMQATHVPTGASCWDNKFRWFNTGGV